jgi:hypothetical protein
MPTLKLQTKTGDPQVARFFISETFNTTNKVFAQCDGLGNPCTGKEPYTGRTERILVDENQYVRTAKMKFIDTMFKEMSTEYDAAQRLKRTS